MSDNTTRGASSGGDTIADVDNGTSKTQIMRVSNRAGLVSRQNPLAVASLSMGALWQRFTDQYARRLEQSADLAALLQQRLALAPHVPIVFGIYPGTGSLAGGTTVFITVDSSVGCTGGTVGGVALTSFAIVDAHTVSGVTGANAAGLVSATVTNASGASAASGAFTYASTFARASLALTGFWKDFPGTTWVGSASAGASSGRSLTASPPATVSATLNGHAGADFDGISKTLNSGSGTGESLSSFFTSTAGSFWFLGQARTAIADPGATNRFSEPAFLGDNGATYFGVNFGAAGVDFATIDPTATYFETPVVALATSVVALVQGYWDGANIYMRVNNSAWQSTASGGLSATGLAGHLSMGLGFGASPNLDGIIYEAATIDSVFSLTTFDQIGLDVQTDYALSLGF